jgi:regulator of RNase E activity RraA
MIGQRHNAAPAPAPAPALDLLRAFEGVATPLISDNMARMPGAVGLRKYHRQGRMVGPAFTVRTSPGDNLAIHQALVLARPGDIIVVDAGGDTSRALVGEIMMAIAVQNGIRGFVIDGAIRDCAAFAASDFGCFARDVIHKGPYKNGPGEINVPVCIGGFVIESGDIVVGDEDGVVAFPQSDAAALLEAARAQEAREAAMMETIRRGLYDGAYAKPSTPA